MTRLTVFQEKMKDLADAALIGSPRNQFYLSGVRYDDGYLLILPDAAYLLADFRYIEVARRDAAAGFEVVLTEGGMLRAVADLLADRRIGRLLLEEAHMTLAQKERLCAVAPHTEMKTGAGRLLGEMRVYKDAREIAAMTAAQELTDAAFSQIGRAHV